MKKLTYILLSVVVITLTFYSCVNDTDYDTPLISCDFQETDMVGTEISLETIIAYGDNNSDAIYLFDEDSSEYISGYVTSDDKTGNFYKEVYIQNKASDPTHAIKLMVDVSDLFTKYDVGRKVYVYLKGLAFYKYHGEYSLGSVNAVSQMDEMSENTARANILRNCEAVAISPLNLGSPINVSDEHLGKYVQFDNVQFELLDLIKESFVSPGDSFDSHRLMISCEDNSQIRLETSTYASFKNSLMPNGKGSVKGILTRDYGDAFYVLRVNDPEAFSFEAERCGPAFLDCNNPNVGGDTVLFLEDFESYNANDTNFPGWTNVNVNGGNTRFKAGSYQSDKYVKCSAYSTGENPLEAWLVTPAINLDSTTDEELTFVTQTGYNYGVPLSVWVSSDFTGDVTTANWDYVISNIANGPDDTYSDWIHSGSVDLSCLDGDVYIAFKYLGSSDGVTTTIQIDNVKVTGN